MVGTKDLLGVMVENRNQQVVEDNQKESVGCKMILNIRLALLVHIQVQADMKD